MPHAAMLAALAAGLLGGLHCLAMCGAYVALAQSGPIPLRPHRAIVADLAAAHAARLATYVTLGALLGAAGGTALATSVSPLQRGLYLVANLLLLALAVGIVRGRTAPAALEAVGARAYAALAPAAGRALRGHGVGARLGLGVLWGLTPCALVYGVLPLALLSGGAWQGAAIMLAFGLGTLPNLLAAGVLVARARRWFASPAARWAAGAIVAGFALVGVWRALTASDALGASPFCFV